MFTLIPRALRRTLLATLLSMVALGSPGPALAGSFDDFFHAIEVDNADAIKDLLQRGFDPNSHDAQGQTGLGLAIIKDSPRVAAVLASQPALAVDERNNAGETALMLAALRGNVPMMRTLLARGAQVQQPGWSALHYAATGGNVDAVRLMLEQGAALNALSPNGSTPLMMAARYGSEAAVDLLLARGADAALRNQKGLNAADFAAGAGRDKLAARLATAAGLATAASAAR
jgi:ankyrin repeat protein